MSYGNPSTAPMFNFVDSKLVMKRNFKNNKETSRSSTQLTATVNKSGAHFCIFRISMNIYQQNYYVYGIHEAHVMVFCVCVFEILYIDKVIGSKDHILCGPHGPILDINIKIITSHHITHAYNQLPFSDRLYTRIAPQIYE